MRSRAAYLLSCVLMLGHTGLLRAEDAIYPVNPVENARLTCLVRATLQCLDRHDSLAWEAADVNEPRGMVLAGGRLYVTTGVRLLAYEIDSGKRVLDLTLDATLFDPVWMDGRLLLADQAGSLRLLNASDGHEIWRRRLSGGWVYPPAVHQGHVYTGGSEGMLWGLRLADGHPLWQRRLGNELVYSPVVSGESLWLSAFDRRLRAVDPASGQQRWERLLAAPLLQLQAEGDVLMAAGYDGMLYGFNSKTGSPLWKAKVADSSRFRFHLRDGLVAVISETGDFTLLDVPAGNRLQVMHFNGRFRVAPVISDSGIRLYPETGSPIAIRLKRGQSGPAVANGGRR